MAEQVVAIDQKGKGKTLKQFRLYVYPDEVTKSLHVLTVGDKKSQHDDVKLGCKFVEVLRSHQASDERQEETRTLQMPKRYDSVQQMLEDLPVANDFKKEVARQASERIATLLFALRNAKGITQQEVAQQLGCTQPTVSKIERGPDDAIRIGEIRAYAKLLKCDVEIAFIPQSMSRIDRVKHHAIQIQRLSDALDSDAKELLAEAPESRQPQVYITA